MRNASALVFFILVGTFTFVPVTAANAQVVVQPGTDTSAQAVPRAGLRKLRGQLGASINNPGLQQSFDLSWRRALSASHRLMLAGALRDSFVHRQLHRTLTPS